MNIEVFQELNLEPDDVIRDFEVSLGLAIAYREGNGDDQSQINYLPIAATYYRRAAANSLLLGHFSDAKNLFQDAARIYRKLGMPYSAAIASLAFGGQMNRFEIPDKWLYHSNDYSIEEKYVPQLAYIILAQISNRELNDFSYEIIIKTRRFLEPYRLQPIGILGMSVGSILDISDSIIPDLGKRRVDIAEAITPFLSAYNSALNQSLQNRYVWRLLAFPFHPAEPDIYSVLTMSEAALRFRQDTTIKRYIQESPISSHSRYLMNSILDGIFNNNDYHFQNG